MSEDLEDHDVIPKGKDGGTRAKQEKEQETVKTVKEMLP